MALFPITGIILHFWKNIMENPIWLRNSHLIYSSKFSFENGLFIIFVQKCKIAPVIGNKAINIYVRTINEQRKLIGRFLPFFPIQVCLTQDANCSAFSCTAHLASIRTVYIGVCNTEQFFS